MSLFLNRRKKARDFRGAILKMYPESTVSFGPLGFRCTIRENGLIRADERGSSVVLVLTRALTWAALVAAVVLPLVVERAARVQGGIPHGVSLFATLAAVTLVGYAACKWLATDAPRSFGVVPFQIAQKQARLRAKMAASLARAYWGAVWLTPWPARLLNWWPWGWFSYGNRPIELAKDAILEGMEFLVDVGKEDLRDLTKQNIFDQAVENALQFAGQSAEKWGRAVKIQQYLHIIGFFIGAVGLAMNTWNVFLG